LEEHEDAEKCRQSNHQQQKNFNHFFQLLQDSSVSKIPILAQRNS
jgi:hypothetical protein